MNADKTFGSDSMALAVLFIACSATLRGQPKPVSICDLFEDPVKWNGVLIKVSGDLAPGSGEGGPWLSGLKCKAQIVVKGARFPNLIELTDPKDRSRLHQTDLEWDEQSRDRLAHMIYSIDRQAEHIYATVVGIFETRVPLDRLVDETAPSPDRGFGHMGGTPAQILVKTITDFRVERNQKSSDSGKAGQEQKR